MKEPEEIIKKFDYITYELSKEFGDKNHNFTVKQVIEIIKQTQKEAFNEALDLVAEKATTKLETLGKEFHLSCNVVDKESITKLKIK